MTEWSEHKIESIFELITLENPYIDSLFGPIYEFTLFKFFGDICLIGGTTRDKSCVVVDNISQCKDMQFF